MMHYLRVQRDRAASVALLAAGALALVLGWFGVSGSSTTKEQIAYVASGGFASLFLAVVGGTLWLSADLRDEWRKLDQLAESLDGQAGARPAGDVRDARKAGTEVAAPHVTAHPLSRAGAG